MMRIDTVKGPLPEGLLETVSSLYGESDSKYRDIGFCNAKFNLNPNGSSLHAFLYDEERAVGHYALIPVKAQMGDVVIRSAKAEALFVADEYRSCMVMLEGRECGATQALMSSLYSFARENGIALIHMIASDEVGILHRMNRFSRFKFAAESYRFLMGGARPFPKLNIASLLRWFLPFFQRTVYLLWGTIFAGYRLREVSLDEESELAGADSLCSKDPDGSGDWTFKVSRADLKWFEATSYVRFLRSGSGSLMAAVEVLPGERVELVAVNAESMGLFRALCFLTGLVRYATGVGAKSVTVSFWSDSSHPAGLRRALRLLLFAPFQRKLNLFARKDSELIVNTERAVLHPYFYVGS